MVENTLHRIKQFIDFKGLSVAAFEKSVGISNGAFASQLKNNKTIGVDKIENILRIYEELNPTWLLTGVGSMTNDVYLRQTDHLSVFNDHSASYGKASDKKLETQSVPLYNIEAAAGIVTLFNDVNHQHPVDYISIPNLPKCDGAVYVAGDSMYPLLKSGDIIMYKQAMDLSNTIFFWGEMYLIGLDHDGDDLVVVKYIQKSEKGDDYVKLVSQNQHHDPIDLHKSKIRALALVKASIRINSMI